MSKTDWIFLANLDQNLSSSRTVSSILRFGARMGGRQQQPAASEGVPPKITYLYYMQCQSTAPHKFAQDAMSQGLIPLAL